MSGVQPEATAEYCRFCGDRADLSGETYTYVRWPNEVDRAEGVFRFTICRDCALQDRDNVEQAACSSTRQIETTFSPATSVGPLLRVC
nr:hypothetical protein [Haloarcula japonica]